MASVAPDELWRLWKTEQITPEMAIGQLIQNQVNHEQAMQSVNLARAALRRDLDGCAAQVKAQQKLLETLQQAVATLQRQGDGPVRAPKPTARKDDPTAGAQS